MKFTVYVPDELGQSAKDAGLNLSKILQNALLKEMNYMTTVTALAEDTERIEVSIVDRNGDLRTYAFNGRWIVHPEGDLSQGRSGCGVAVTRKGQIAVYTTKNGEGESIESYPNLDSTDLDEDIKQVVASRMGVEHVIDLDI